MEICRVRLVFGQTYLRGCISQNEIYNKIRHRLPFLKRKFFTFSLVLLQGFKLVVPENPSECCSCQLLNSEFTSGFSDL